MGNSADRRRQRRLPLQPAPVPSSEPASLPEDPPKQDPWYESNSLWGAGSLGVGIVLSVVAAMLKDLRWLLWIAWPCFILFGLSASRAVHSGKLRLILIAGTTVISGSGLLWLNAALRPAPMLEITFTSSPLFANARRARIKQDIGDFFSYLTSRGFQLPSKVPTIGIGGEGLPIEMNRGGATSMTLIFRDGISVGTYLFRSYPGLKPSAEFDQGLRIYEESLDNRGAAVSVYSDYALMEAMGVSTHDPTEALFKTGSEMAIAASGYFVESFEGHPIKGDKNSITNALWVMRQKFGQVFTDELVATAVRAFSNSPNRLADIDNPQAYFFNRLADADQVIDDRSANLKALTEIWIANELLK